MLEPFLSADAINLSYSDGLLFRRMEHLIDGNVPEVSLFSDPYYFMQQLGFRKVLDTSFMMAAMLADDASLEDIDLQPELYTHYYREEFPERFRDQIDTRLFGPSERIVYEEYSKDIYDKSRQWIDERSIFEEGIGHCDFEQAVIL